MGCNGQGVVGFAERSRGVEQVTESRGVGQQVADRDRLLCGFRDERSLGINAAEYAFIGEFGQKARYGIVEMEASLLISINTATAVIGLVMLAILNRVRASSGAAEHDPACRSRPNTRVFPASDQEHVSRRAVLIHLGSEKVAHVIEALIDIPTAAGVETGSAGGACARADVAERAGATARAAPHPERQRRECGRRESDSQGPGGADAGAEFLIGSPCRGTFSITLPRSVAICSGQDGQTTMTDLR